MQIIDVARIRIEQAVRHLEFLYGTAKGRAVRIEEAYFYHIVVAAVPWEVGDIQRQLIQVVGAEKYTVCPNAKDIGWWVADLEIDDQMVSAVGTAIAGVHIQVVDFAGAALSKTVGHREFHD